VAAAWVAWAIWTSELSSMSHCQMGPFRAPSSLDTRKQAGVDGRRSAEAPRKYVEWVLADAWATERLRGLTITPSHHPMHVREAEALTSCLRQKHIECLLKRDDLKTETTLRKL
jgi:hypothetical protein